MQIVGGRISRQGMKRMTGYREDYLQIQEIAFNDDDDNVEVN